MRYFLTSVGIVVLIVAMIGWTPFENVEPSSEQAVTGKASMLMKGKGSFSGKQSVGMMDCQGIHEQIRKATDYSDLFNTPAKGEKCPVVSSAAYEALE